MCTRLCARDQVRERVTEPTYRDLDFLKLRHVSTTFLKTVGVIDISMTQMPTGVCVRVCVKYVLDF